MHLIAVSQHHNPTCIIWGCVTQNLKQKLKPEYISICRLRSSSLMFLLPFGKEKYILYNFQIHREKRFVFFFIYFLQNNNNNIQKPVTKDFFSSFLLFGFFKFGSFIFEIEWNERNGEKKKSKTRFQLENSYTWSEPSIRRSSNQTSEKKQWAHTCSYCIIPLYTIDHCTFAFWCRTDCLSSERLSSTSYMYMIRKRCIPAWIKQSEDWKGEVKDNKFKHRKNYLSVCSIITVCCECTYLKASQALQARESPSIPWLFERKTLMFRRI